ncbi:phosphoribosylanthranilate isomerase [Arthrobacter sp. lap29]|uniref:phosphoribosylanthranilate isomerase n=1 Tax=Arthrobacter sp. lap29 TaxID=3056122 RepID=UPI0028F6FAAB|nr:phosphoribosylanthranilate isomerase [Arthrobacter sp. lap29]
MYVKICGLQTAETIAAAVAAGADALGFVFAPGSPRTVSAELVAELGREVPAGIEIVGVFRNQPIDQVIKIAARAQVGTIQLHGEETLQDMARIHNAGFQSLRAFSAPLYNSLSPDEKIAWDGERLLLDAVEPGAGVTFDAAVLSAGKPHGFWLLAGGLNPHNVAAAAKAMQPSGVDVSSGVESSRGVKSVHLIPDFITAARLEITTAAASGMTQGLPED